VTFALLLALLAFLILSPRIPYTSAVRTTVELFAATVILLWTGCAVWTVAEMFRAGFGKAGCLLLAFMGGWALLVAPLSLIALAFVPDPPVCPNCGEQVKRSATSCPYCLTHLQSQPLVASTPARPEPQVDADERG
jgi:hypothetical protein